MGCFLNYLDLFIWLVWAFALYVLLLRMGVKRREHGWIKVGQRWLPPQLQHTINIFFNLSPRKHAFHRAWLLGYPKLDYC
jgi:hypothetical protein